jgi:uncharacterized protein YueI
MLSVKRTMLLSLLCLTTAAVTAQQTNPALTAAFSNQAQSIVSSELNLSNAMSFAKGQQASIKLADDFIFPGEVISNDQVYSNLQTIIVRSAAFNNALLQISKQTNADKSVNYVAHIFGNKSSDGFQLKKSADGRYVFQKFETEIILQDCHLQ